MKFDKKCIKLIKQSDQKTIEYVYSTYYKLVKYHIYEMVRNNEDAEELTQDVFIKVFERIEQYDNNYSFVTWITNIAKRTAIDYLRKKRPDIEYVDDISVLYDNEEASLFGELDEKMRCLLSEEEYTIVSYRVYFDLKFVDIGKMLNISTATTTSKYYKAIRRLKKELKEEDFYD